MARQTGSVTFRSDVLSAAKMWYYLCEGSLAHFGVRAPMSHVHTVPLWHPSSANLEPSNFQALSFH